MEKNYIEMIWSKESIRYIFLLRSLYTSIGGMSIDELSKNLSMNRRSIRRLLSNLNELSQDEPYEIEISDKGICYFKGNKIDYYKLRGKIIDQEVIIVLAKKLLTQKKINIKEFCTSQYLSESTFRRYLRKVNSLLETLNLRVRVRENEVYIDGEESLIRYCLVTIFWRSYHGVVWPFETIEENKIEEILSRIYSREINISQGKKKQFSFYLAVYILRSEAGNKIKRESLPVYAHSLVQSTPYFSIFSQKMSNFFDMELLEIEFIFFSLYTFPEAFRYLQSVSDILEVIEKQGKNTYKRIRHFLFFIKERYPNFNINSDDTSMFISMLISSSIFVDLFHGVYFNSSSILIFEYTKKHFPNLLPSIEKELKEYEPELSQGALQGLTLRFAQAYVAEFSPQDFEPKISILLSTDLPAYLDVIIKRRMSASLSSKFNIEWLNQDPNVMPDLLLATGVVSDEFDEIPHIFINAEINQKDYNKIIMECEKILDQKRKQE